LNSFTSANRPTISLLFGLKFHSPMHSAPAISRNLKKYLIQTSCFFRTRHDLIYSFQNSFEMIMIASTNWWFRLLRPHLCIQILKNSICQKLYLASMSTTSLFIGKNLQTRKQISHAKEHSPTRWIQSKSPYFKKWIISVILSSFVNVLFK
jgi:hypothetical protein